MALREALKEAAIVLALLGVSVLLAVAVYAVAAPDLFTGDDDASFTDGQWEICPLTGKKILKGSCPMVEKKKKELEIRN